MIQQAQLQRRSQISKPEYVHCKSGAFHVSHFRERVECPYLHERCKMIATLSRSCAPLHTGMSKPQNLNSCAWSDLTRA